MCYQSHYKKPIFTYKFSSFCNDDAIRAVKLISGAMADAALEGKQGEQDAPAAEEPAAEAAAE